MCALCVSSSCVCVVCVIIICVVANYRDCVMCFSCTYGFCLGWRGVPLRNYMVMVQMPPCVVLSCSTSSGNGARSGFPSRVKDVNALRFPSCSGAT